MNSHHSAAASSYSGGHHHSTHHGSYVDALHTSAGGIDFLSRIMSPGAASPRRAPPGAAHLASPIRAPSQDMGLPPRSVMGAMGYGAGSPRGVERRPVPGTPVSRPPLPQYHLGTPGVPAANGGPVSFTPDRPPLIAPAAAMSTPVMQPAQRPSASAGRSGETGGRQHWSLDDFELGPKLGEGRFGKIYLARERRTRAAVALKCIAKEAVTRTGLVDQLRAEIELQHRAGKESRHVVRLFAYFWDDSTIFLALEYAEGGDLRAALDAAGGRMHESDAAVCVGDVASGLAYLHRSGLAHRDLKPENILLRKGRCKIADFTWVADCASERRTTVCGTLDYLAPEVVRSEEYNGAAVDLWCLGVLAYELLAGKPPFERPQSAETCRAILEGRIEFPPGVSDAAADLIVNLLRVDPRERLPASTVLHHPWVQAHRPAAASSSRSRVSPSPFLASLRRYGSTRSSVSQVPASQDHHTHTSSVARSADVAAQRHPAPQTGTGAVPRQQPCEMSARQSIEVSRALDMSGGAASDAGASGAVVSTAAPSHVGSAEAPPSADTTAKLESSAPSLPDVPPGRHSSVMQPPDTDNDDATPDESSVDDGPPDVSAITLGEV